MSVLQRLTHSFAESHPEEVAELLETQSGQDLATVLRRMSPEVVSGVLQRMTPTAGARALGAFEAKRSSELLGLLPPRHASAVLLQLSEEKQGPIVAGLPASTVTFLRALADHPEDTAGAMMDPRVTTIRISLTAQQAINTLRKSPREAIVYLYVTDPKGKLEGIVTLRDLLLAHPNDKIADLAKRDLVTVTPDMRADELAELIRTRRFLALPVVDTEGVLLGVVRHGRLVSAVQEEVFEEFQRMVGAGASEEALSPAGTVIRKRLPWLIVNLGTAFLAAAVVGLFEGAIARVTALAVLLPIVAGQGGNTGAQALAVMLRGLALDEIPPGQAKRVVRKELLASLVNGVVIAALTALALLAWDGRPLLAGVVGVAMVVNMVGAALAGTLIPLILQQLGRDPAQSASIFLTTVTDIVGFAAMLGFAVPFLDALTSTT